MANRAKDVVKRLKGFAESLENSDCVTDKFTCRTIRLNLEPHDYTGDLVRGTRAKLGASQSIFAQFLGVSVKTVQDWEQERKTPRDVACRLMDEIRRNPDYWLARLKELSETVDREHKLAEC